MTNKKNNIGVLIGYIIGELLLLAIAVAAFNYFDIEVDDYFSLPHWIIIGSYAVINLFIFKYLIKNNLLNKEDFLILTKIRNIFDYLIEFFIFLFISCILLMQFFDSLIITVIASVICALVLTLIWRKISKLF
ncbi:MAG: hypothetical protein PQ612_05515 [Rickettsiales bacterium]|nr:hypothetical protein [Pseudomonadota bacterium]MDA0966478.1 hypothetical protein [Pseudomonadota bacterium]MDG4543340.1 hypothetical protein [Rickettsiales bacterium]MDG4545606.1 hypothetical protein [Rickettsiales bacterium]MDG4548055.1 hypothetical protein [Rickettsiales bacterium]